jgi:hypothetical protein
VVTALGYGTTGLSVGQRVFGLTDWTRDGTLAEYVAVEARNLAPLPGDVDFTVGASLPISGLTAWQGLFEHGRIQAGQRVLAHGAAGAVGSMVVQLAGEVGAYVIGSGRAADRQKALDFGAQEFVDLDNDALEDVGSIDLVFDVIGGDIGRRSARLIRPGGTLVSIVGPSDARPVDGLAIDFVVESDRAQLSEIVQRVRDGRLRTNIGTVTLLENARCRMGEMSDAIALLERAEQTLDDVGDRRLIYFAREIKAHAFLRLGDAASAAEILEINGLRRFGDRWGVAHGLALASWASRLLGLNEQAVAFGKESLALRRAEGDRYGEAESLAMLAAAASANGDETTSFALLQQSRGIRQAIGDRAGLAECDAELARIAAPA